PRWPWLRLFRIIELEVVVSELRPKLLRLLRELATLRVDFCDTGGVFHFVNHVSIRHRHDVAGDEGGSREHPRRHQAVAVWQNVDGQLDETQREMQSGVKLLIFGYCLHPLPDPVADDEEEEAPTLEVCGKRI